MKVIKSAIVCVFLLLLVSANSAFAADNQKMVDFILKSDPPPLGVVFEIVEGDPKALAWAIPQAIKFSKQLRNKFPNIDIAVVTHGKEQFALTTERTKDNEKVHKAVKSLVADNIPVQVCGTHASWYGKTEKDFPDYVEVVPAAPTTINNYEDMGYEKIVLDKP